MISKEQFDREVDLIIVNAIREDVGDGDHSSLACIPEEARGKANCLSRTGGCLPGSILHKRFLSMSMRDSL